MKTNTLCNKMRDIKLAFRDLYSSARISGMTQSEMLTRKQEIQTRYNMIKLPNWARAELQGYWNGFVDAQSHADLVFGITIDGKFYSVNRDRPDYYEKNGFSPQAFADVNDNGTRGLYWAKNLKPHFISAHHS